MTMARKFNLPIYHMLFLKLDISDFAFEKVSNRCQIYIVLNIMVEFKP